MPQLLYPPSVGKPIAEQTENDFCREFSAKVAEHIARHFYSYDGPGGYGHGRASRPELMAAERT